MSAEILMNNQKVVQDLGDIAEKQATNGLLGAVGLVTDDHDCSLDLRYEMYEQEGEPELCLLVTFSSQSDEVDEESFRWEQIAETISEEVEIRSESWTEEAQSVLEDFYGTCLFYDGNQVY